MPLLYGKFESTALLTDSLLTRISSVCSESVKHQGFATIGVSGGSMVSILSKLPHAFENDSEMQSAVEQGKIRVLLCDERKVQYENKESTYGQYQIVWAGSKLLQNMVPIEPSGSLEACAEDYENKLKTATQGSMKLDLALLGIGPDGHTCSLFPNHSLLKENRVGIVSIADSPKPPPERVTLSLPAVKMAKTKLVIATGAAKAPIVKRVVFDQEVNEELPVSLISGSNNDTEWLLDNDSCSV